tara:strand:+ start:184 stop:495 length:312 start_codon:yes stop_codon:yes gene_type:complete
MKKITQESVAAFEAGNNFRKGNTEVENVDGEVRLRLHGHTIAKSNAQGLFVSNAGWETKTTKERLNGIQGVSIRQSDFVWYLNGEEMPSNEFVKIGSPSFAEH